MSRNQGIVKVWNIDGGGFEFIEVGEFPYDYDLFFHSSSCQDDYWPTKCDIVTFIETMGDDGRKKADCVLPTGESVDLYHFDGRVSRRKLEMARQTHRKYDRGCTCEEDLAKVEDPWDLPRGKCWYCNEMYD